MDCDGKLVAPGAALCTDVVNGLVIEATGLDSGMSRTCTMNNELSSTDGEDGETSKTLSDLVGGMMLWRVGETDMSSILEEESIMGCEEIGNDGDDVGS